MKPASHRAFPAPVGSPQSGAGRQVFGEVIAAGQAAGELAAGADPRAAALVLFDAYIGVITRWFATPPAERFDLRAALRQALAIVLHGIARQPAQ
jgi:hypothetical protein